MQNDQRNKLTVGCLFAAIGGFCQAFRKLGATVAWANEKDRFAAETFRLNFPDVRYLNKPVEDLTVRGDALEPVDVLTAGFPCQPFSVAGEKRGLKDERGLLFLHIIRLIKEFGQRKPKILLLENVKHFKSHDHGRTFKRVQAEIQKTGYWFTEANAKILNTLDYTEIPQNRERIFMVALSCDHFAANNFQFPEPLPEGSLRRVKEFLDLDRKASENFYFKPGSQYYPLFAEEIEKGGRDSIYQLRRNYVRKNMSGTCFTLMANMGDGGHNQPVIKDRWGIRKLTPRECARLQGYGDWFRIPESLSNTQIYKQIGNSVTVPLVARIAENVIAELGQLRTTKAA
ncbi:MAG TPA: DNA (cytosine-5-)-methyltransferase [Verrucomicrobiae bacterium]|nr:DNA (cytosine-5-)-methyltransferase [Verrucomicrobiae bacterium]